MTTAMALLAFGIAFSSGQTQAQVHTIDGQVVPGLSWKNKTATPLPGGEGNYGYPRNPVEFIRHSYSMASAGGATDWYYVARAKSGDQFQPASAKKQLTPTGREGGGGMQKAVSSAIVASGGRNSGSDFEFLVAKKSPDKIIEWVELKNGKIPGNAISVGDQNQIAVAIRMRRINEFGFVANGNETLLTETNRSWGKTFKNPSDRVDALKTAKREILVAKNVSPIQKAKTVDGAASLESKVAGNYERRPAENGWHRGRITLKNGKYFWQNEAGSRWELTPDFANLQLKKAPGSDYYDSDDGKVIRLIVENGQLVGFKHMSDTFVSTED